MLVPKKEVEASHQKFKQFKKFSLQLYQKHYHVYENELILSKKIKKTNPNMLDSIKQKVKLDEMSNQQKGVKFQVKVAQEKPDHFFLKKFDYNYHQSVNISLSERVVFHLNANIQSKGEYGFYSGTTAFSYHMQNTYYRLGLSWGPQINYYVMASRQLSTNWSVGVLVSLLEKTRLSKNKLITTLRYKNNLIYACLGYQNMVGFKTYPIYNDDTKLYLNPYYGKDHLEGCTSGLSKKLTDKTRINVELTLSPWIVQISSSLLLKVNDWAKLFLTYEIQNMNAFVNFGIKIKNFYLGLPLFSLNLTDKSQAIWITPLVFGMACLAFFWDKIHPKLPFIKKKGEIEADALQNKLDKRQKDLKLISRRVREIFNEETRKNGLVIIEAYYGSRELINQLISQSLSDRIRSADSPDYLHKVLDITDSMRFYVDNSRFQLPKGEKTDLYGLYQLELPENTTPVIYIKYAYQGEEKEKFFIETEAIILP